MSTIVVRRQTSEVAVTAFAVDRIIVRSSGPPGAAGSGAGGSGVHNDLTGRSTADAHPQSAITGLVTALSTLSSSIQALSDRVAEQGTEDVDSVWGQIDQLWPRLVANEGLAGAINTTLNSHVSNTSNPHSVTPAQLGLVIGTDVQAWDADLDTWATKTAPTGAVVGHSDTITLTNKTLAAGTVVSSAVMNLGSDAEGDLYYRNASGALVRRGIGSAGQVLGVSSGLPVWVDTKINIQVFSASGTWTKPSNFVAGRARLWGAGGGGASGPRAAGGNTIRGGAGGGSGRYIEFEFTTVGATEAVAIGAAGTGGAAHATDNANGSSGAAGGSTTFAGMIAPGGAGGANNGTGGVGGGSFGGGGWPNWTTSSLTYPGGGSATTSSASTGGAAADFINATGGGAGGWVNGSGAAQAGAAGGAITTSRGLWTTPVAGGTAGAVATVGGAGAQSVWGMGLGGGGGGAAASGSTPAGAGGNGGSWGGGGGGGGASVSTGASGAGGNGGAGYAYIVSYCNG